MTFIPSVQSKVDTNNTWTNSTDTTNTGTGTNTTGYNYIILSINSNKNSISNGIQVYAYDEGESPSIYYSDNYKANTNYSRSFKIVKKYYYIKYRLESTPTINLTSRLSTSYQEDTIGNNPSTFDYSKEYALDAFGKLRVSEPQTLLEIKFQAQNTGESNFLSNTLFLCSDTSGSYSADTSGNGYLTIRGTNSGHYISQSRQFTVYQPGKSLLLMFTGIIAPNNGGETYISGFTGRIGYYTNYYIYNTDNTIPYNGLYFQYDSSGCSINLCNKGTIKTYLQSQWNLDTMDGIGPSGINLNFFKAQLFSFDLEWLSIGRIRFGFFAYGRVHYCHQITNINELVEPYISSINLPIRYELIGTGTGGETASIKQICSTVISEGGYNPVGRPFAVPSTGVFPVSINTISGTSSSSELPLLALRGGGVNYFHQNIIPLNLSVVDIDKNNINLWRLRLYQDSDTSKVDASGWINVNSSYSVSDYTYTFGASWVPTGSILISQGIFSGKGTVSFNDLKDIFTSQILHITSNINLTSDILVLTCQILSGSNTEIYSTIEITEHY